MRGTIVHSKDRCSYLVLSRASGFLAGRTQADRDRVLEMWVAEDTSANLILSLQAWFQLEAVIHLRLAAVAELCERT